MKKRLLCLVLCILLLLPAVLIGCTKKSDMEDKFQQTATSLTMWVVTEDENSVSAEAAKLVNEKIDELTKSRFKIHLEIKYIPKSIYRQTMDQEISAFAESYGNVEVDPNAKPKYAETEENEYGITVIKYPAIRDHQVDVVYIQDREMYFDYIQNGWLSTLDKELDGNSKILRSNINDYLLQAAEYDGEVYAIPNNRAIGEYTVMLLNKQLMQETDTDSVLSDINSFYNPYIYNFLDDIKAKNDSSILPIESSYEDCLNLLAYYWNIDPDTLENDESFSVVGYRYEDAANLSRNVELKFNSLFSDETFVKSFLKLKEYQFGGYFGTASEGKKAAISIQTMGYGELSAYLSAESEYYPVVLRNPTISEEDVYNGMFGVCKVGGTDNETASMKIITLLNTDVDFRNLLQYGVENKTYKFIDPDNSGHNIISYLPECNYRMNIFATGNAFIAYPQPEMDENIWEYGKVQNRDVPGIDPTMNLSFRSIALDSMTEDDILLETKDYQVRLSTQISKTSITANTVIWNWFTNHCATASANSLQVLKSEKSLENGKKKYTYLAYAGGLQYDQTVDIDTEQTETGFTVNMFFDDVEDDSNLRKAMIAVWQKELAIDAAAKTYSIKEEDLREALDAAQDYSLWLVTVETEASAGNVEFALYRNGELANPAITVPETDPTFTYCGKLNSELIRMLYSLNKDLVAQINSCTSYSQVKELVREMEYLLTPKTENQWVLQINAPGGNQKEMNKYTALSDVVSKYDLQKINYALISATSIETQHQLGVGIDAGGSQVVEEITYDSDAKEVIRDLESAFSLYHDWLLLNEYISK